MIIYTTLSFPSLFTIHRLVGTCEKNFQMQDESGTLVFVEQLIFLLFYTKRISDEMKD